MQTILEVLKSLEVGKPVSHRNLTVVPLFGAGHGTRDYLTLDEALEENLVEITEVSRGGSVNNLRLKNRADKAVFILDGEELIGAKQNRVLNLTVLAPAQQEITIPVSCVEQGRWSYRTSRMVTSRQTLSPDLRARKQEQVLHSRLEYGEAYADQAALWQEISDRLYRMSVRSDTGAYHDVYQQFAVSVEEYAQNIAPVTGQVGVVFAVNGQISSMDLFDTADTFSLYFPKLLRSAALDAIDYYSEQPSSLDAVAVPNFLECISQSSMRVFPAVGEGEDVRIAGQELVGSALVARGRVLHLCAFQQRGLNLETRYRVGENLRRRRFTL